MNMIHHVVDTIEDEKTVADAAVPEALSATPRLVDYLEIKALPTNTDFVRIGFQAADGSQKWALVPGEWRALPKVPGRKYNLAAVYVDVNVNAEGVAYIGYVS